jgi:hypothetical protein
MERFAPIFTNTIPIAKSCEEPIKSEMDCDGAIVIPIPERVAIVQSRRIEKIRLETAGLCACIGIVGWNSKNIGCIHWDLGQDKQDMKRFADDLTNNQEVLSETVFLLVTNLLSERLESVYQFLHEYAPTCSIFLEAEHYHGGYVIVEDPINSPHSWFYNSRDQDKYFDSQSKKRKPWKLKSVSIKSHFSEEESPFGFTATKPTKRLQEYFVNLDSCLFMWGYSNDYNPSDFWDKYYPEKKADEPEMMWVIAEKLYNAFKARRTNSSPQKLIYLYDSKDSLPKID